MAISDLFSKRQKKLRGEVPDVYKYEEIPRAFRVQIVHLIKDTFGDERSLEADKRYEFIHKTLCKEYGIFGFKENPKTYADDILSYFLDCTDYESCLDIIEICFKVIKHDIADTWGYQQYTGSYQEPEDAINELNARFKESGIGYQFESGKLMRVDSQFIHSETVKPTLQVLGSDQEYSGANDEFLKAHEHYRHKRYKECLNDCLKSFESLMKAIHKKHSWTYNKNDTATKLIASCFTNELIPNYLQSQFSSIRNVMESGITTVRNRESGHGQGSEVSSVPEHLASYVLHLTATNLLFLANCEERYKQ